MIPARRAMPAAAFLCASALASCGGSSDDSTPNTTAQTQPAPTTAPAPTVSVPTVTTPSRTTTAPPPQTVTTPAPPPKKSKLACGNVAGNFIKSIQTDGAPCSAARAVARGWLTQVQKGSNPAHPISVSGYTCAARFRGELAAVLCERSGARIVFAAQP